MHELSERRPRYPPPAGPKYGKDVDRRLFSGDLLRGSGLEPGKISEDASIAKEANSEAASSVNLRKLGRREFQMTHWTVLGIAIGGVVLLTACLVFLIYFFLKHRSGHKRRSGPYMPACPVEDETPVTPDWRRLRKKNPNINNVGQEGEVRDSWPANDMWQPTLLVTEELLEAPQTAMVAAQGVRMPSTWGERGTGSASPDRTPGGPRIYVSPSHITSTPRESFKTRVQVSGEKGLSLSQILNRTELRLVPVGDGLESPDKKEILQASASHSRQMPLVATTHSKHLPYDTAVSKDSMADEAENRMFAAHDTFAGLTSSSRVTAVRLRARELPDPEKGQNQPLSRHDSVSSRSSGLSTVYSVGDEYDDEGRPIDQSGLTSTANSSVLSKQATHHTAVLPPHLPDPSTSSSPPKAVPAWSNRKGFAPSPSRRRSGNLGQIEQDSPSHIRHGNAKRDTLTPGRISSLNNSVISQTPSLVFPAPSTDTPGLPRGFIISPSDATPSFARSPGSVAHALYGADSGLEVDLEALTRELEEEMEKERCWQLEKQSKQAETAPDEHPA